MSVGDIELDIIMDSPNIEKEEAVSKKSDNYRRDVFISDYVGRVDPDINSCLTGECGQGLQEVAQTVMMDNIYR